MNSATQSLRVSCSHMVYRRRNERRKLWLAEKISLRVIVALVVLYLLILDPSVRHLAVQLIGTISRL